MRATASRFMDQHLRQKSELGLVNHSLAPSRVILVDLDGVLRHWPENDAAIEQRFDLPIGSIRKTAFDWTLLAPAITGIVSDEQWRQRITATLAGQYPGADCASAVLEWSAQARTVDRDALNILLSASRNGAHKLVLVTNATTRLRQDLETLGLSRALDEVVNSSEVGYAKPDSAMFTAALAAGGCATSKALFVDDSLKNVEAALQLGIKAHLYRSAKGLVDFLADAGVPSGAA